MPHRSKNRLEILNWRRHGDDESYCRVGAFPAGDSRTLCDEVDGELGITREDRLRWAQLGDGESERIRERKLWYVNDHIVLEDGQHIVRNGRTFRIRVQAAQFIGKSKNGSITFLPRFTFGRRSSGFR
jgi:hypothetical protein